MPTYVVKCKKHGKNEIEKSYSSTDPDRCPICKTKKVRRIIGLVEIRFIGDGFTKSTHDSKNK